MPGQTGRALDETAMWRPSGFPPADRAIVEALVAEHLRSISSDLAAHTIGVDVATERVAALAAFRAEAGVA